MSWLKKRFRTVKNWGHWLLASLAVIRYGYPAGRLQVIGVTGTDGKTTTSSLIFHLLKTAHYQVALISTVGAYIGSDSLDTGFHVTSPGPFSLQRLLRRIANAGYTHVVLEVTSHGLDQHRVLGANIRTAVITNVTPEHLDYHLTYTRYCQAKAKLFKHARLVILNADDQSYPILKGYLKSSNRLLTYSRQRMGDYKSVLTSYFPQAYNQSNALAVITLARELKLSKSLVKLSLTTFSGVEGRFELIPNARGLRLVVDFAHTPNALSAVLNSLRLTTTGKLIAVFGAAGERDSFKRPVMGHIGASLADEVVLTSEDPRHEDPRLIMRQMLDGVNNNHGHIHSVIDRSAAIRFAINNLAQTGDTVGVFGKGHEQAMNLDGSHEIPWSDKQAILAVLNGRSKYE